MRVYNSDGYDNVLFYHSRKLANKILPLMNRMVEGLKCLQSNVQPCLVLQGAGQIVPCVQAGPAKGRVGGEQVRQVGDQGVGHVGQGCIFLSSYLFRLS